MWSVASNMTKLKEITVFMGDSTGLSRKNTTTFSALEMESFACENRKSLHFSVDVKGPLLIIAARLLMISSLKLQDTTLLSSSSLARTGQHLGRKRH